MSLFSLENLYRQYIACRRNKRNTINALRFEARYELNLLALRDELVDRSYQPGRSVCFFVERPKLREVFAADFRDRVVHHVLVDHLEKTWEPIFIHDSYACRRDKGVHAAVARLQKFMRQITANATRPAWALQLDIRNYFMSIDRRLLLEMLEARLRSCDPQDEEARWLCAVLLSHDCTANPVLKGDPRLVDRLPKHKTLFYAPPDKGLPIGNLNSQFFANVYLNALDQFVKHELKCRHYLRYCDDCVLLGKDPQQLIAWRDRIAQFLEDRLQLQLNARQWLRPVSDGVDFLGYIVRPHHLLVRRRVVGHWRERLQRFKSALVEHGAGLTTYRYDEGALSALQSTLASYLGHVQHAASYRLIVRILTEHPWLETFFDIDPVLCRVKRRDRPPTDARNVLGQYRHWCEVFPHDEVWIQVGAFIERLQWPPCRLRHRSSTPERAVELAAGMRRMRPTARGAVCGFPLPQLPRRLGARIASGRSVVLVAQTEVPAGRIRQRKPVRRWVPV